MVVNLYICLLYSEIEEEIAVLPSEKDEEEIFSSGGLTGGENEDTYFSDMKNSTVAGQHRVRFVDDEADKSDENLQTEMFVFVAYSEVWEIE